MRPAGFVRTFLVMKISMDDKFFHLLEIKSKYFTYMSTFYEPYTKINYIETKRLSYAHAHTHECIVIGNKNYMFKLAES